MKGSNSKYRPNVGETCLISGPHCDDDEGYTFGEYKVLWKSDIFLLYGSDNCWPNIVKWDNVLVKPLNT